MGARGGGLALFLVLAGCAGPSARDALPELHLPDLLDPACPATEEPLRYLETVHPDWRDTFPERAQVFPVNETLLDETGWQAAYDFLAGQDTSTDNASRPVVVAWWDNGRATPVLGGHPWVPCAFPMGHVPVAGFLMSTTDEEMYRWMAVMVLAEAHRTGTMAGLQAVLDVRGIELGAPDSWYDDLAPAEGDDLYAALVAAGGHPIGYLVVDSRMMPTRYDYSTFYAPAFIAGKDPEDFVRRTCVGQPPHGITLSLDAYQLDEEGRSMLLPEPVWRDGQGRVWDVVDAGPVQSRAVPSDARDEAPRDCARLTEVSQRFHETTFAKAFAGLDARRSSPGDGLAHWRAVAESIDGDTRHLVVLKHYAGVTVDGLVVDAQGEPVVGLGITFRDGYGATHDVGVTGEDGAFSVKAPFSVFNETGEGDLSLVAMAGDDVVLESSTYQFTLEQALGGDHVSGVEVVA